MPSKVDALAPLRPVAYRKPIYSRFPPLLCGLTLKDKKYHTMLKPADYKQWTQWSNAKQAAKQKAGDNFPLFLLHFLSDESVMQRVADEFKVEAEIGDALMNLKNRSMGEDYLLPAYEAMMTITGAQTVAGSKGKKKKVAAHRDVNGFFSAGGPKQSPDLLYGSWSLYSEYLSFFKDRGPTTSNVFTGLGKFFGQWTDKKKKITSMKTLETCLRQMVKAAKALQGAMYSYNGETKTHDVALTHAIIRLHRGADKNFVSKLKTEYLSRNGLVLQLLDLKLKGEKSFTADAKGHKKQVAEAGKLVQLFYEEQKFTEVFVIKQHNIKEDNTRATLAILNPIIVKEAVFREVVVSMLASVFDMTGKTKWDVVQLQPPKIDFDDESYQSRLCTAMLLLQLCVGSRISGIIFANKIMKLDARTKQDDDKEEKMGEARSILLSGINDPALVRVTNLTKEKYSHAARVANTMTTNELAGVEQGMTYAKAEELVLRESADHFIDKPMQYYLLDPTKYVQLPAKKGKRKPSEFYTSSKIERQNAREVFLQLLRLVRAEVRKISERAETKIPWRRYNMDDGSENEQKGRMIDYVEYDDLKTAAQRLQFSQLYQKLYTKCNEESKHYLGNIKSLGNMTTTHTFRRLYTCYSFEYFGRGRLKEVGYAQYVLRHKSIETSIRYTVLQFDMTIDSVVTDKAKLSNAVTMEWNKLKMLVDEEASKLTGRIETLKRTLEDYEGLVEAKVKRIKKEPIFETFKVDGKDVQVKRKPRGLKNLPAEDRIKAGLEMVDRLEEAGVPVNRSNLIRVGVSNDDIVVQVLTRYKGL